MRSPFGVTTLLSCAILSAASLPTLAVGPATSAGGSEEGVSQQVTGTALAQSTAPAPDSRSFELVPGVVVDRVQPAVYTMNAAQGIDAVNPLSGALLWNSSAAAKPLLVRGTELVAQAEPDRSGALTVVELQAGSGTAQGSIRLALPAGVAAGIDDRLGSTFDAWVVERAGQVELGWRSTALRTSPLPPTRDEAPMAILSSGAALQLQTATSVPLSDAPVRAAKSVALTAASQQSAGRVSAGPVMAATEQHQQQLVLQRWETQTGSRLNDLVLTTGEYHLRLPSADGRHLLVSRKADRDSADGYLFEVFSLETGERLGQVSNRRSSAQFFVVGNTFVFESPAFSRRRGDAMEASPRKLVAMDLVTGDLVWEREIRDTRFRGQRPR